MRLPLELTDRLTREEEEALRAYLRRNPDAKDRFLGVLSTLVVASRPQYSHKPAVAMDDAVDAFLWLTICRPCRGHGIASPPIAENWTRELIRGVGVHPPPAEKPAPLRLRRARPRRCLPRKTPAHLLAGRCPACLGKGRRGGKVGGCQGQEGQGAFLAVLGSRRGNPEGGR